MSPGDFVQQSLAAFRRGAIWPDAPMELELIRKLEKCRPEEGGLRLKFGMDPSSPDLHVGHAVVLLKLRDLGRLGHTIVLIVGDATAMVGDPSGRNKLRPQLTREEVERNLVTYTDQAMLLLRDVQGRIEVVRNSQWFDGMRFEQLLRLLGRRTVAQTLAREDFQKRLAENAPIGLHELVYPVMQGWDSVQVRADVEFGGTDQLFNLLVGRDLQEQEGQEPQVVVMSPLLNGLDGRKMSKSYGNAIGLTDPPQEIFGKTMRITDLVMATWFENLTRLDTAEYMELIRRSPRDAKERLACELVELLHGKEASRQAREHFRRVHVDRNLPVDIPVVTFSGPWPPEGAPLSVIMREIGMAPSGSAARQLIAQGGVHLDHELVRDPAHLVPRPGAEILIQVGTRRFARVRPG